VTRKLRRLILIGSSLGVLAFAVALVLSALRESIASFNSPAAIAENNPAPGRAFALAAW
jgi:cytochrome c-type biogenesis protein CcmE